VATFTQLASGNWRVQVRRKTRYAAKTFRTRKDSEEWARQSASLTNGVPVLRGCAMDHHACLRI